MMRLLKIRMILHIVERNVVIGKPSKQEFPQFVRRLRPSKEFCSFRDAWVRLALYERPGVFPLH
jgi:hypothetical protein